MMKRQKISGNAVDMEARNDVRKYNLSKFMNGRKISFIKLSLYPLSEAMREQSKQQINDMKIKTREKSIAN
jgi:hypothetical protein